MIFYHYLKIINKKKDFTFVKPFLYIMLSKFLLENTSSWSDPLVTYRGIEPRTPWLKVKCSTDWASKPHGRDSRIWTYECHSQSVVPYRLAISLNMGWTMGLEPTTTSATNWRSTNWTTFTIWCVLRDSNSWPTP